MNDIEIYQFNNPSTDPANEYHRHDEDYCDVCGEEVDDHGYYTCDCYSPCCGARMHDDCDICPDCKEHCI